VTISTRLSPNCAMVSQSLSAESGPMNTVGRGIGTTREVGHWKSLSRR
jgi:hypothetical protein